MNKTTENNQEQATNEAPGKAKIEEYPCDRYIDNARATLRRAESLAPEKLKAVAADVLQLIEQHKFLTEKLKRIIKAIQADEICQSETLSREYQQTEREVKYLLRCCDAFLCNTSYAMRSTSYGEFFYAALAPESYRESYRAVQERLNNLSTTKTGN